MNVGSIRAKGKKAIEALTQEKVTPQSLEAEQATLGAMMMEREAIKRVLTLLTAEDFYREIHRVIYNCILLLFKRDEPVDLITVVEELRRHGALEEVGGAAYLTAIIEHTPSAANVESYAKAVKEKSVQRQAIFFADKVQQLGYGGSSMDEIVAYLRSQSTEIEKQSVISRAAQLDDLIISLPELMQLKLPDPRWAVPGLIPEGLTLFAGKAKMAKSWLILQASLAIACGGAVLGTTFVEEGDVLYLGLEDSRRRLQDRSRILMQQLQNRPIPKRLTVATKWKRLNEGGLELLEEWLQRTPQARMVVIDVLQTVRPPRTANAGIYDDDYSVVGSLKDLATKYNVAIVAVHHLNKSQLDDVLDQISGSSGMQGAPDCLLTLSRKRGEKQAVLTATGKDVDTQLALEWNDQLASWTCMGDAEEIGRKTIKTQILQLLEDDGESMTPTEIGGIMGKSSGHIRVELMGLKKQGLVSNDGFGKWSRARDPETNQYVQPLTDGFGNLTSTSTNSTNAANAYAARPVNADYTEPYQAQSDHEEAQNEPVGLFAVPPANEAASVNTVSVSTPATQDANDVQANNDEVNHGSPSPGFPVAEPILILLPSEAKQKDKRDALLASIAKLLGVQVSDYSPQERDDIVEFVLQWQAHSSRALTPPLFREYFGQWFENGKSFVVEESQ